eukprot:gene17964-18199_t
MGDFDVIVVGSGAAGAAAAWRLAAKGFKVACVERGPYMDPSAYPSTRTDWEVQKRTAMSPVAATRGAEQDYPVDDASSPVAVCNFNAVGGSTILYSGHFPRFRPDDFRLATVEGLAEDWPLSYQDLRPYFELNEDMMSVAGLAGDPYYPDIEKLLPPVPLGEVGTALARAFNAKGWHWWPSYAAISTRAVRGRSQCLNLGPCNTGCPQGAKSSSDNTYLARGRLAGLTVLADTAASEIVTERGRVTGVRVTTKDRTRTTLHSPRVVLAASAIGTPRILLNSRSEDEPRGLGNAHDQVGRNLMIHPLGYVEGVFPTALDTDVGPQGCMLYSLEHYRSPGAEHRLGYMMHALRGTGPLETAQSAYGRRKLRFGAELYDDFLAFWRKQVVISIICEDLPDPANRVELDLSRRDGFGDPGVRVNYTLSDNTRKMMTHGMGKAREVLSEAGAKRTYAHGPVRNTGWHVMGTARMGADPASSVVDARGKVHGVDGLYVADSSVFVTSSCVNPANTIQAKLLFAMFPGDPVRGFPSFESLGLDTPELAGGELTAAIAAIYAEATASPPGDVNDILRAVRKSHPGPAQDFIDAALTAYFTARTVVEHLQNGKDTLFPNARTLPEIDYTERFAVVTGANRGIGLAITERLVGEGYRVAACVRSVSEPLENLLTKTEGNIVVTLDLGDDAAISDAARQVLKWSKQIDGLVNCAGVASGGLFSMTRMDQMRAVFQVNTFGPLLFTQYITRSMTRAKAGSIVNIGSTAGLLADPGTLAYGGSKAAIMHATRVLASELGPSGIRVNAIAPAIVETDMAAQMDEAARQALDARSVLPGQIMANDVAGLVSFLFSNDASKITGQVLRLDRGLAN